jgi:hypothetical protein
MGVGEDEAVVRQDHALPHAGHKPARTRLEGHIAHVYAHHRIEQPVETGAHCAAGGPGRERQEKQGKGASPD